MKTSHPSVEKWFERMAEGFIRIFGHVYTFVGACVLVIIYLANPIFYRQNFHECIRDLIFCFTFLSFFIIQKVFNKYTTVTQIKINELLASNENASTRLVNIETKTEAELKELAELYKDLSELATTSGDTHASASIDKIDKSSPEKE